MNAAIRSIVKTGSAHADEIVGVLDGYAGLLNGESRPLTLVDVDNIARMGGAFRSPT